MARAGEMTAGRSEPSWPGRPRFRRSGELVVCGAGKFIAKAVASSLPLIAASAAHAQEGPGISNSLSYMTAFGQKNYPVVTLLYGLIAISLGVVAIIGILVLAGTIVRGRRTPGGLLQSIPVERGGSGLPFIYIGVGITVVILFGSATWNYFVLAEVAAPPSDTVATIQVVGHQWWWEFDYSDKDPSKTFATANEMHIPVGKPVRVVVTTADVIHSFWVPALSGKTDTIPGQRNMTWIEADRPGIYRGACTEYCGQQHGHMGLLAIAESPQKFQAWWNHQLQGPPRASSEAEISAVGGGKAVFMQHCAVCHAIRGTSADGKVGPDLSHLMDRKSLAAATLPNSIGALMGWISNPQQIKPGNFMPTLDLSSADLNSLRAFLQTLR